MADRSGTRKQVDHLGEINLIFHLIEMVQLCFLLNKNLYSRLKFFKKIYDQESFTSSKSASLDLN